MYQLLRRLLFTLDPEVAHDLTIGFLSATKFLLRAVGPRVKGQKVKVFGMEFPGHLGLAAGLDKDARLGSIWSAFGFGFVEVGSVTPRPQKGNPKPRLFRLPREKALLNRMGFNSSGVRAVRENLLKDPHFVPLGINVGKNRDTPNDEAHNDYIFVIEKLYDLGDYFVINVSSPNTEGLRNLQFGENLERLLGEVYRWRRWKRPRKPLLLKLAPELEIEALEKVAKACEKNDIDGVILTNTLKVKEGGLSGKPLFEISTRRLKEWREISSLPMVGVGGVFSHRDAEVKLNAGASLVQILTGFVYRGLEVFNGREGPKGKRP
ncbi:MAG: quinone-dependent dihydroorotate dehydrogenase [Thermotogae bacterium]|nr:quinone-dependent dihydroorotate dehydrogenase [Thermotogota bacterium]